MPDFAVEDSRRVVVIGTGPAGSAAAYALYQAGIPVLVLEAGQEADAAGLTVRMGGFTVAHLRRSSLELPASGTWTEPRWLSDLVPGGLTNHWSCAVPRFSPEDFTDGEALGERWRWPIKYDDLRDDYGAMERLLHICGSGVDVPNRPAGEVASRISLKADWQNVVQQAAARGFGITAVPRAYGEWAFTRGSTPFNSFVRMLKPLRRSRKFDILFGARATRLEWSQGEGRVTRIHFLRDGRAESAEASHVVVAANAVASSRLLLESRSEEFPDGLGNGYGIVGRYLHDHPAGKIELSVARPVSIHPPAYVTRGPYAQSSPLSGVASILWGGSRMRARSLMSFSPNRQEQLGFSLFGSMIPNEESRIELGRASDGATTPIRIHLHFDRVTLEAMHRGRDQLLELLSAAGLQPKMTKWLIEPEGDSVHLGGTSRMHESPKYGVVDGFCRLHAARNVRVVDSGVFTTGPEKNPTLTAMAIAHRSARQLVDELRRG